MALRIARVTSRMPGTGRRPNAMQDISAQVAEASWSYELGARSGGDIRFTDRPAAGAPLVDGTELVIDDVVGATRQRLWGGHLIDPEFQYAEGGHLMSATARLQDYVAIFERIQALCLPPAPLPVPPPDPLPPPEPDHSVRADVAGEGRGAFVRRLLTTATLTGNDDAGRGPTVPGFAGGWAAAENLGLGGIVDMAGGTMDDVPDTWIGSGVRDDGIPIASVLNEVSTLAGPTVFWHIRAGQGTESNGIPRPVREMVWDLVDTSTTVALSERDYIDCRYRSSRSRLRTAVSLYVERSLTERRVNEISQVGIWDRVFGRGNNPTNPDLGYVNQSVPAIPQYPIPDQQFTVPSFTVNDQQFTVPAFTRNDQRFTVPAYRSPARTSGGRTHDIRQAGGPVNVPNVTSLSITIRSSGSVQTGPEAGAEVEVESSPFNIATTSGVIQVASRSGPTQVNVDIHAGIADIAAYNFTVQGFTHPAFDFTVQGFTHPAYDFTVRGTTVPGVVERPIVDSQARHPRPPEAPPADQRGWSLDQSEADRLAGIEGGSGRYITSVINQQLFGIENESDLNRVARELVRRYQPQETIELTVLPDRLAPATRANLMRLRPGMSFTAPRQGLANAPWLCTGFGGHMVAEDLLEITLRGVRLVDGQATGHMRSGPAGLYRALFSIFRD